MNDAAECVQQVDDLLNVPQQVWLLGAGISKDSGVPLMATLTDRVSDVLDDPYARLYKLLRADLNDTANVEDVLTHLGDFISLLSRKRENAVELGGESLSSKVLEELHIQIRKAISETVRFGYRPGQGEDGERIGSRDKPIVTIDAHLAFVNALFKKRRAGLERRPPVSFFTTNYDTLLEDSLALARIPTHDWFSGGAMAFWDPGSFDEVATAGYRADKAVIHKLHGSVDWFMSDEDIVVRRRDGAGYPSDLSERLLIYPQATKYQLAQKDPFSTLFSKFRDAIRSSETTLLGICGSSFRDDHINEEIETAMKERGNCLTLLAFVKQDQDESDGTGSGLPGAIMGWLADETSSWRDRLVVAGSHGLYLGSLQNACLQPDSGCFDWWSFQGLTDFLARGPESLS